MSDAFHSLKDSLQRHLLRLDVYRPALQSTHGPHVCDCVRGECPLYRAVFMDRTYMYWIFRFLRLARYARRPGFLKQLIHWESHDDTQEKGQLLPHVLRWLAFAVFHSMPVRLVLLPDDVSNPFYWTHSTQKPLDFVTVFMTFQDVMHNIVAEALKTILRTLHEVQPLFDTLKCTGAELSMELADEFREVIVPLALPHGRQGRKRPCTPTTPQGRQGRKRPCTPTAPIKKQASRKKQEESADEEDDDEDTTKMLFPEFDVCRP